MRNVKNRRSRKSQLQGSDDLDLKPFMNLFVVLIPFLLACAQFAKITLVEIKLPEQSDRPVAVKKKTAEEEGLNLTVIVTDRAVTLGAKGGFLPYIQYREFHKYSSLSDKNEFVVEYDPKEPDKAVYSNTDGRKVTPQERMDINLIACERKNLDDKGKIIKAYYNKFGELITDKNGKLIKNLNVGDKVYVLPKRNQEVVKSISDYSLKDLSVYDKLMADLLIIKSKYQGQGMKDEDDIIIAAEDEIAYDKIIQIIDVCHTVGFPNVSIAKMRG